MRQGWKAQPTLRPTTPAARAAAADNLGCSCTTLASARSACAAPRRASLEDRLHVGRDGVVAIAFRRQHGKNRGRVIRDMVPDHARQKAREAAPRRLDERYAFQCGIGQRVGNALLRRPQAQWPAFRRKAMRQADGRF